MDSKNNFNINMIVILFIIFYILYIINDLKNKIKIKEHFNQVGYNFSQFHNILSSLVSGKGLVIPGTFLIKNNLNTSGNISIDGDIITKKNLKVEGTFNLLQKGIVVAWTGDSAPEGWALCNGQNGTPDLRGRFILGSGQGASLTKRVNKTIGGTETETLTYDHLPPIYSSITPDNQNASDNSGVRNRDRLGSLNIIYNGGQVPTNQPHNNMPPFYVLAYIMKL